MAGGSSGRRRATGAMKQCGKSIVMAARFRQNQSFRVQTMATWNQATTTRDRAMTACIKSIFLRVFYIDGAGPYTYLVILGFLKFPVVFIVSECFQNQ